MQMSRFFGSMLVIMVMVWIGLIVGGIFLIKHCNFFSF